MHQRPEVKNEGWSADTFSSFLILPLPASISRSLRLLPLSDSSRRFGELRALLIQIKAPQNLVKWILIPAWTLQKKKKIATHTLWAVERSRLFRIDYTSRSSASRLRISGPSPNKSVCHLVLGAWTWAQDVRLGATLASALGRFQQLNPIRPKQTQSTLLSVLGFPIVFPRVVSKS